MLHTGKSCTLAVAYAPKNQVELAILLHPSSSMESSSDINGDARKRAVNTSIAKLLATMDDPKRHAEAQKEVQEVMLKPLIAMQEKGVEGSSPGEIPLESSSLRSQEEHVPPTNTHMETSQPRGMEEAKAKQRHVCSRHNSSIDRKGKFCIKD